MFTQVLLNVYTSFINKTADCKIIYLIFSYFIIIFCFIIDEVLVFYNKYKKSTFSKTNH